MKFWFLFAPLLAFGVIIETARFQEIESYAEPDTLILLDIDDTLLIPVQMLGCDEWFKDRLDLHLKEGDSPHLALEKSLAEWEAVRHLTKMEIVEPGTEGVIRALQEKQCAVMGLTTQGLALATRTALQLKENRIDLSVSAPSGSDHFLTQEGHGVLYRRGILFTSGTDKGEALFSLLEQIGCAPRRIVFINDKKSHLREVERSAEKRSVPFIGLRYSHSDAKKNAYDSELADFQFRRSTLAHLLSDDEARAMRSLSSAELIEEIRFP
jgi:hypothetical protein